MGRARNDQLDRVFRQHVDAVHAFLSYSVGRHVAEDLTATTFERVVKAWSRYDASKASERTWILAIARNALTDHYRRQSHRNATSLDEYPLIAERLEATGDEIGVMLSKAAFAGWLSGLGERDRQVLAMRFGADLTGSEIADVLDITEANVHQIVSRALKRLRKKAHVAENPNFE